MKIAATYLAGQFAVKMVLPGQTIPHNYFLFFAVVLVEHT